MKDQYDHVPLESFQTAWQAAIPIPVQINYDVPASSFLQSIPPMHDNIIGNNYVMSLHPPEETTASVIDALAANKFQEQVNMELASKAAASQRHVLLDSVAKSVDGIVRDLMTPLAALPNPFA